MQKRTSKIKSKTGPKRNIRRITKPKVTRVRKTTPPISEIKVEKILVENFVSLQKVMTNLSVKFDNLANQISKLLELFEISAKALAQKDFEDKDTRKIIEKIDNLLDQNKTIARGLTLLHETMSDEETTLSESQLPVQPNSVPKKIQSQTSKKTMKMEGYEKSISSRYPIK